MRGAGSKGTAGERGYQHKNEFHDRIETKVWVNELARKEGRLRKKVHSEIRQSKKVHITVRDIKSGGRHNTSTSQPLPRLDDQPVLP